MKKIILGAFAFMLFAYASNAQVVVKVMPVVPVVKVVAPPRPGPKHVWIDGHWIWDKRMKNYVWKEGYWATPRRGHHHFVQGHWDNVPGGVKWIPGHWTR
ncbi:MAG: hypothetical protein A3K10_01810 [Bacteroidetes bacterium RIFCSPLOWO2_12_FULL_31_6]|nr:MAG: hypothetical protein A3K10_01810 [Bacteroidetes bacterium RIFCSPLOWO2_12_FULL_31_6]